MPNPWLKPAASTSSTGVSAPWTYASTVSAAIRSDSYANERKPASTSSAKISLRANAKAGSPCVGSPSASRSLPAAGPARNSETVIGADVTCTGVPGGAGVGARHVKFSFTLRFVP